MSTFGFIGTGNMGSALSQVVAGSVGGENIWLANRTPAKAQKLAQELGAHYGTNEDCAGCTYVFLAVKPQMMEGVLEQLRPVLAARKDRFVLVSVATGLEVNTLQRMAGGDYPVIRVMPSTPVTVGACVAIYCCSEQVTAEEEAEMVQLLQPCGMVDKLDEHLFNAGAAVAGSGVGFAAVMIEAMADGAVACGLPRPKAIAYASWALMGMGKLQLHTGQHPGVLKDAVCSPGGSTIAGVHALEAGGFRAAAMQAIEATCARNKELG